MKNIQITQVSKKSIPETIQLIEEGYKVNYKEGSPESKPYFSETYTEDVELGKIRLFVAKLSGDIVGSVQYEDREDTAYLSQMTVDPNYRKKGIGADLLQTAEVSAKSEGFEKMQLTAMVEKGLPSYYKKLGYVEVGIKERPKYTLIIMEKNL